MDDVPLFNIVTPTPDIEQQCDVCKRSTVASVDGLRASGWTAYNGTSFTGQPLAVRVCPTCRRKGGESYDAARDRLASVPQVHPCLPGADW